MRRGHVGIWLFAAIAIAGAQVQRPPEEILRGREALAARDFVQARAMFAEYLKSHPANVEAELGLADVELGMHRYESAELAYRKIVFDHPLLWAAHKNLIVVEASLGRWEEFDRERAVLRAARERGAAGISARESDLIDAFDAGGKHWIVREYYEPVGRTLTRYNFELFTDGKVKEYVSLESAEAAKAAFANPAEVAPKVATKSYALNWYNGASHGTVASYVGVEPTYEHVRSDVMRWLRKSAAATMKEGRR